MALIALIMLSLLLLIVTDCYYLVALCKQRCRCILSTGMWPRKDAEIFKVVKFKTMTDDNMRNAMAANAHPMIGSRYERGFVRMYETFCKCYN